MGFLGRHRERGIAPSFEWQGGFDCPILTVTLSTRDECATSFVGVMGKRRNFAFAFRRGSLSMEWVGKSPGSRLNRAPRVFFVRYLGSFPQERNVSAAFGDDYSCDSGEGLLSDSVVNLAVGVSRKSHV